MSNVKLDKGDYKSLRVFYKALKNLLKNGEVMGHLNLQSKAPNLLVEVIAVLKLHDEFKKSPIIWFGGSQKDYDVKVGNVCIQVKNISVARKWHMRNHKLEEYTIGQKPNLQIDVSKTMKELHSKYYYPYLFVDITDIRNPIFYCYSKKRTIKEIKSTLKMHNKWLKEPRKRGTGQKNLWDPTLEVTPKTKSKFKELMI